MPRTERRCYCPGDCNCRHSGPPFNRPNYCGCKAHDDDLDPVTISQERARGIARACPVTFGERISAARRAQLVAHYERNGWPADLLRLLSRYPDVSLAEALDGFSVPARAVA